MDTRLRLEDVLLRLLLQKSVKDSGFSGPQWFNFRVFRLRLFH